MPKKTYKVIDGPLSVRQEPGGQWLKQYETGYQFVADSDTEKTSGGYIWIQHNEGWSALSKADKSQVFCNPIEGDPEPENEEPEAKTLYFKTNRQVRVRQAPSLAATHLRWLAEGESFETQSTTRTEAYGYVWWQHKEGWSAEQSLDGRLVFMTQIDPPDDTSTTTTQDNTATTTTTTQDDTSTTDKQDNTTTTTTTTPGAAAPAIPVATPTVLKLQASTDVRVRSEADLSGAFIKWIAAGTVVEFNAASEITNDGYVWLHHADGWSAWKNTAGTTVFLVEPGSVEDLPVMTEDGPDVTTLPGLKTLIKRLPVAIEQTAWWQYFGNNVYAYEHGTEWGYDSYAQGLHSGLDFGNNNSGIPVVAGIDCTYVNEDRYGVHCKTGSYSIIYQHLMNTTAFTAGQQISADTKIGELDPSVRLRHLHFEIRYKGAWIVNPLLFMSDDMVNQITTKFNPSNSIYFYKSGAWNKWQTPMDQPVIKLGGPVIGPTAG